MEPSSNGYLDGPVEQEIFKRLVASKEPASKMIPADMEPAELWRYLTVTAKALNRAQLAITTLKPMFGRMLLMVRNYPALYTQYGYQTYNDFMTDGVPSLFGISRAEAYECAKVADVLGFMTTEQMTDLGFSKLKPLATAIKRTTMPGTPIELVEKSRAYWVEQAENSTVQQLRDKIEADGVAAPGEMQPRVPLVFYVNPEDDKFLRDFFGSDEIKAYANSEQWGDILMCMAEECKTEWTSQMNEAVRGV